MSEDKPDKKDEPLFEVSIVDKIEDNDIKQYMKTIIEQNIAFAADNKEMKEIITKQATERELNKFNIERNTIMEELQKVSPQLHKIHEKTQDLNILKEVVKTADLVMHGFPEFKKEEDKKAVKPITHIVPKKYI